jgi:hypothetical protein
VTARRTRAAGVERVRWEEDGSPRWHRARMGAARLLVRLDQDAVHLTEPWHAWVFLRGWLISSAYPTERGAKRAAVAIARRLGAR